MRLREKEIEKRIYFVKIHRDQTEFSMRIVREVGSSISVYAFRVSHW